MCKETAGLLAAFPSRTTFKAALLAHSLCSLGAPGAKKPCLPSASFHCVYFFCSTDWKDYDGREPRHRGQIEALERLLQQVRASRQSYSCRGKDKYPCGRAPGEASVAPVILAAFYLGHTFSFIRKRKILILAHLESL